MNFHPRDHERQGQQPDPHCAFLDQVFGLVVITG